MLQHPGNDPGLGCRAEGGAVGSVLDVDGRVGVGVFEGRAGKEEVPGNVPERRLDARIAGRCVGGDLVGELTAKHAG